MGVDLSRVENARFLDRSQKRIFDTNVRQAYGFSEWKQGMMPGGAASGKFVYLSVPLTESERCLLTSSDQSCWHSLVRFFWHLGQLRNSCTAHSPMSRSQRREAYARPVTDGLSNNSAPSCSLISKLLEDSVHER